EVKTSLRDPEGQFEQGPITLTARDTETNPDPAWVVEDGNYVSARWPGDAYKFSRTFAELLESGPREPIDRAPIGIEFAETMRGFVSSTVVDDYEAAAKAGKAAGSAFELTLTIASDDLEQLITNPAHSARMSGTIRAPALSPGPIAASDGVFNLFVTDPEHVDTRLMRYRAPLATEEGRRYLLSGFKTVHDDPGG